jgi:hypothetical protein
MKLSPKTTHALVIGIGRYAAGPDWDLPAAVPDALRVVDWLLGRGVPPGQIEVFLSPTEENANLVVPAGVAAHPATREAIDMQAIRTRLRTKRGALLWCYWAGHGFLQRDGSRRLLYADATEANQVNVDVSDLLAFLLTHYFPRGSWARQILITDACANFASHEKWPFQLPKDALPQGQEVGGRQQFALFATRPGQRAEEDDLSRSGLVTGELLRWLDGAPAEVWPPDLPELCQRLVRRFEELSEAGQAQQVPSYYSYRDWHGNLRVERGVGQTAPNDAVPRSIWPDLTEAGRTRLINLLRGVNRFAEPQVRERIVSALELDHVPWADSDRQHAALIIDACCACDWGLAALVDGLDALKLEVVPQLAACLDEVAPLGPMNWIELAQLLDLVARGLSVPADRAAQALRRCGEPLPPARREHLFRRALQILARRTKSAEGSHPLLRFLEHCRPSFPPGAPVAEFDLWEQKRAQELAVDLDAVRRELLPRPGDPATTRPAAPEPERPPAILQFKVAPTETLGRTTAAEQPRYGVTAWLVLNGTAIEPNNLPKEKPVAAEALAAELAGAVRESLDLLEAHSPAASLRVEGFLPLELLEGDWDLSPIRVGPKHQRPLGTRYPFVFRSYDRFYSDEYLESRAELRRRWAQVNGPLADTEIAWARSAADWSPGLSTQFERGAVAFVALGLAEGAATSQRRETLEDLLTWGVPLAVVLRGCRDTEQNPVAALRLLLLVDPPLRWPEKTPRLRQAEQLERLACAGLTLLWDDPSSVPPDFKRRLHQPV